MLIYVNNHPYRGCVTPDVVSTNNMELLLKCLLNQGGSSVIKYRGVGI